MKKSKFTRVYLKDITNTADSEANCEADSQADSEADSWAKIMFFYRKRTWC